MHRLSRQLVASTRLSGAKCRLNSPGRAFRCPSTLTTTWKRCYSTRKPPSFQNLLALLQPEMEEHQAAEVVAALMLNADSQGARDSISHAIEKNLGHLDHDRLFVLINSHVENPPADKFAYLVKTPTNISQLPHSLRASTPSSSSSTPAGESISTEDVTPKQPITASKPIEESGKQELEKSRKHLLEAIMGSKNEVTPELQDLAKDFAKYPPTRTRKLRPPPPELSPEQQELDAAEEFYSFFHNIDRALFDDIYSQINDLSLMPYFARLEEWERDKLSELILDLPNFRGGARFSIASQIASLLYRVDAPLRLSVPLPTPEVIAEEPSHDRLVEVMKTLSLRKRGSLSDDMDNKKKSPEEEDGEDLEFQEFPNLLTHDPIMDSRDEVEFPPTGENPFHGRVVVRNHYPFLTEQEDRIGKNEFTQPSELPDEGDPHLMEEEEQGMKSEDEEDEMTPEERAGFPDLDTSELLVFHPIERRVVQQTPKGKIPGMQVWTIIGDGMGMLGLGQASFETYETAKAKSIVRAYRNLDYIQRFEDRTVWTTMEGKFGACRVIIRPRPVGFGLRCSPMIHQIMKAAGIRDISAKVWGSRNQMNVIQNTVRMLHGGNAPLGMGDGAGGKGRKTHKGIGMRTIYDFQRDRGRKLVPLRK